MARLVFSLFTVFATWVLLLIGGIVNPMGASLACPDWYFFPTCHGELFPEMTGGVLYEHGHRLWASFVGFCTLLLTLWIIADRTLDRLTKGLAFASLFLVCLQGTLGGITVLLKLSAILSTLHLVVAMLFFCLLIWITFRLAQPLQLPDFTSNMQTLSYKISSSPSNWLLASALLTLLQILLGGTIRHIGAGLACGTDWLFCGPEIWPSWHLGQVHMAHRFLGYGLCIMIGITVFKTRKEALLRAQTTLASLSLIPLLLVASQIGLGIATIATIRSVYLVVLHTGVGALLLASLFVLYLLSVSQNASFFLQHTVKQKEMA